MATKMIIMVALLGILLLLMKRSSSLMINVVSFGAKADGKTDSTEAFAGAWGKACSWPSAASIVVPAGGRFFLKKAVFAGPCNNSHITFTMMGATLLGPSDYRLIGNTPNWIFFQHLDGLTISGGILDAQGSSLWSCKNSAASGCPHGATTLGISNSKNIKVNGVTSLNSQMFHIVLNGCENVKIQGVRVSASASSPNTDGIHVQMSRSVTILDSRIATGDDCVSVGPGSRDLWIENIWCGPGHGISIGSLGKEAEEAGVENVTVSRATLKGTQNGLRIKSWGRPSTGFARGILFQHAVMVNVDNPILIDQNYCPDNKGCPGQASGVRVSDVTYQDVHGTSATQVAVKLECSWKNPCTNINLQHVNLTYNNHPATASCVHASSCL